MPMHIHHAIPRQPNRERFLDVELCNELSVLGVGERAVEREEGVVGIVILGSSVSVSNLRPPRRAGSGQSDSSSGLKHRRSVFQIHGDNWSFKFEATIAVEVEVVPVRSSSSIRRHADKKVG